MTLCRICVNFTSDWQKNHKQPNFIQILERFVSSSSSALISHYNYNIYREEESLKFSKTHLNCLIISIQSHIYVILIIKNEMMKKCGTIMTDSRPHGRGSVCCSVVHTPSLCFAVLQSTPCLPSLNTWWSSPTWPSTWRLSGTLGAKRWSWPRRLKTNDTRPQPQLVGREKTSTRGTWGHWFKLYQTHLNTERRHEASLCFWCLCQLCRWD